MNKKLLLMTVFMIFITGISFATSVNTCIDTNTLQKNCTLNVGGNDVEISEEKTCSDGCSDTLKSCRPTIPVQLGLIGVFMLFVIVLLIYGKEMRIFKLTILSVSSLASLMFGAGDLFTTPYNTIFLAFGMLLIGYTIFWSVDSKKKNMEVDEFDE